MNKMKMFFTFLILVIFALIIARCGGSSSPTTPGALAVTTASLPGATVGTAYSQTLVASGGTAPYTWSISAGALPAALTLNPSTGVISGTPTTVATVNFTVTVTDSATPTANTATQALSITCTAAGAGGTALAVTTASLPGATVGTAYSQTLAASGGTAPYTWSISAGALPAALTLNPSTGAISGTPTTAATVNFTVMVTDSATPTANSATQALSIAVTAAAPVFDALTFYTTNCKGCHTLGVRTAAQITTAIANIGQMSQFRAGGSNPLTAAQISAIAAVSF